MKIFTRQLFFAALITFQATTAFSQATVLSAGDIAFTGINCTDNTVNGTATNDDLCFILLKNINSGTVIYFTDFGWRSDAQAFQTANPCGASTGSVTDGIVKWTATANMAAGTQVLIRSKFSPTCNLGSVTGFQANFNDPTWFVNISVAGESIFAYTGTAAAPTLIAGINMSAGGWAATLLNCAFSPSASTQPTALNSLNTSFTMAPNVGNMRLKAGVVVPADPVAARAFIANPANWEFSTTTAFVLPSNFTTLPLTLTSFTANAAAAGNEVTWRTANEARVSRYEIERGTDGINFTRVGSINANGRQENAYTFTDARTTVPMYYRLKMIDVDGRASYSNIAISKYSEGNALLNIYPNPTTDKVTLTYTGQPTGKTSVWLTDATGRTISKTVFANGKASFDLTLLPAGVYSVHYKDDAMNKTLQVSKRN